MISDGQMNMGDQAQKRIKNSSKFSLRDKVGDDAFNQDKEHKRNQGDE